MRNYNLYVYHVALRNSGEYNDAFGKKWLIRSSNTDVTH